MTLIEAVKISKYVRRESDNLDFSHINERLGSIELDDLLAEDWQASDPMVIISLPILTHILNKHNTTGRMICEETLFLELQRKGYIE